MSMFLRHILAVTVSGALASSAMAADGTINFTGEVSAVSCKLTGGPGSTVTGSQGAAKVDVSLGKVSADSVPAGGKISASSTYINLLLDCGSTATGLSAVEMRFDPLSGSGLDTHNNSLLQTTGGAKGVGIGIYDHGNKLLNLAANDSITSTLTTGTGATPSTTGTFSMRAAYLANGEPIVPGVANAELPFTLTYK